MELGRLPKGYLNIVKEAKSSVNSAIIHINNSTGKDDIEGKIRALGDFGTISGKYYDRDSIHIDFDYNHRIIGIGAYVNILPNGRMVLGKTCTIFLDKIGADGDPLFVDNYKW